MPQEVRERYLKIREVDSGSVITAIELLSPKNKRVGDGRKSYENKRALILGSLTHLVEIDLLRSGQLAEWRAYRAQITQLHGRKYKLMTMMSHRPWQ